MFNQQPVPQGSAEDLTTAARIRDTAIEVFGEHGFQVGVRKIAAAAGVSPGLVNHHFGSKDGLRAACDDRVLQLIRDEKVKAITASSVKAGMLDALAEIESYAPLVAYMVRSLQAGGPMAESLFEHMAADAEGYIEKAVEAGTIKPSRDPAARARYLMLLNVGATMLYMQMRQHRDEKIDYRKAIRELSEELTPPALEFYTQGLLTDPTILDTFTKEK
ncbi:MULTISPECIES: TetR family transcriptional regulator [Nocardia]|uniref:TetR family transcriptional regulator n=1 Tax=Nocardia implantans TaxID=3108168 RepID=A0ABU6AR41_9NOCA|nr:MULTISPECIES: TetR family transcriptional regulator [Nocardia]MBF6079433.1 TetR family transcriptional regulator [Nocardia beijingensis]MBF6191387.1 TetR family transcriptional regulator [Nocardia beijingensis]MEA3528308.1 TetR family transcriptional regulator [Nocardia sp. CDC192]MEB3509942.1 TetR family transcriptional regulator [Nocardia sp. CDC186]